MRNEEKLVGLESKLEGQLSGHREGCRMRNLLRSCEKARAESSCYHLAGGCDQKFGQISTSDLFYFYFLLNSIMIFLTQKLLLLQMGV